MNAPVSVGLELLIYGTRSLGDQSLIYAVMEKQFQNLFMYKTTMVMYMYLALEDIVICRFEL